MLGLLVDGRSNQQIASTLAVSPRTIAAHVEHSMALLPDGVWVLTAEDGGRARLGDLVTARQSADSTAL